MNAGSVMMMQSYDLIDLMMNAGSVMMMMMMMIVM
jgi:hypothetical protein